MPVKSNADDDMNIIRWRYRKMNYIKLLANGWWIIIPWHNTEPRATVSPNNSNGTHSPPQRKFHTKIRFYY